MPVKIRLQRHGRKKHPFYYIVVANAKAPRNGKFIEKIGIYDPLKKPYLIKLKIDSAVNWLQKGAQPTNTVKSLFSKKGVLYKNHILNGFKKGAFDEEKFQFLFKKWL